jgi:hypothetical protein
MNLWPKIPKDVYTHGITNIDVMENEQGKPILKLNWPATGITVYVTASQAEIIGGVAKGARLRWEDFNNKEMV